MLDYTIRHAGVYRLVQDSYLQTIPCPWLNLHVSGLRRHREIDRGLDLRDPPPFLSLGTPGTRIYFETAAPRENWVVMLDGLPLRAGPKGGTAEIGFNGLWLPVPEFLYLEPNEVSGLVLQFSRILECVNNPLPSNQLSAALTIAGLLRRFVDRPAPTPVSESPAAALRRLLDGDATFGAPLPELSRRCGYSPDHLRALFRTEYGIAPLEYRNRRRMSLAMDLVATTRLTAKEIAARTGFRHLSHFSAAFRHHFGLSPRAAVARFRQPTTPPHACRSDVTPSSRPRAG